MSNEKRVRQTIPQPGNDLASLRATVVAMKELVEVLSGQRGPANDVAFTWEDAVELGLVQKDQVPANVGKYHI